MVQPIRLSIKRNRINTSYQLRRRQQRQQQLLPLHYRDESVNYNDVVMTNDSSRQLQQHTIAMFTYVLPRLIELLALKFEGKPLNLFETHPLLMKISIVGILLFFFVSYIKIPPVFTRTNRTFRIAHVILGTLVIAVLASIFFKEYNPLIYSFLVTYFILSAFPFFNWFHGMFKDFLSRLFTFCFVVLDRIHHGSTSAEVLSTPTPAPMEEEDSVV